MCLCKGEGGIKTIERTGIVFKPCPDTNCEFDREHSEHEFVALCKEFGYVTWTQEMDKLLI